MTKPTSQQVPGVEPVTIEFRIGDTKYVGISATELSALRARETRLRELVVMMEKDTEGATPTLADLAIIYYRKLIESILNEGKA